MKGLKARRFLRAISLLALIAVIFAYPAAPWVEVAMAATDTDPVWADSQACDGTLSNPTGSVPTPDPSTADDNNEATCQDQ